MSELRHHLYKLDMDFLKIIGGFWQLRVLASDRETVVSSMEERMLSEEAIGGVWGGLSDVSKQLLSRFIEGDGTLRKEIIDSFGGIRVIGLRRILRERIWEGMLSPAEELWYRGIIFSGTRTTDSGLQDYYVVPQDFFKLLEKMPEVKKTDSSGVDNTPKRKPFVTRPASPAETAFVKFGCDSILDDITLLLSRMRSGKEIPQLSSLIGPERLRFYRQLIHISGMIDENFEADVEKIRVFLTGNRKAALCSLLTEWVQSQKYREIAEIFPESGFSLSYAAAKVRQTVLRYLTELNTDSWYSVPAFCLSVEHENFDFFRSQITSAEWQLFDEDGESLKAAGCWQQLEGKIIQFWLNGPLFWLNITELGGRGKGFSQAVSFRIRPEGKRFLEIALSGVFSEKLRNLPNGENGVPKFSSDGSILCRNDVSRMFRYQSGRYCEIEKVTEDSVKFMVTPTSLRQALDQGLEIKSFLTLLRRVGGNSVPSVLLKTLHRWDQDRSSAIIYPALIFSAASEEIIDLLTENTRISRWILQKINPTTLIIDQAGIKEIRRLLLENEMFVEIEGEIYE